MKDFRLPIVFSLVFLIVATVVVFSFVSDEESITLSVSSEPMEIIEPVLKTNVVAKNSISSYRGLGAWVDAFDADPNYLRGAATVFPADVVEMSEKKVRTLFLQASRSEDRSNELVSDPWHLANFLLNAHANGLDVVAWYLPKWNVNGEDLERLLALADFEVLGHRFDGLAVDIEWNDDLSLIHI